MFYSFIVLSFFSLSRWHNVEQPFKCDHCGKGCARFHTLGEHVKVHAEVKEHECEVCIYYSFFLFSPSLSGTTLRAILQMLALWQGLCPLPHAGRSCQIPYINHISSQTFLSLSFLLFCSFLSLAIKKLYIKIINYH